MDGGCHYGAPGAGGRGDGEGAWQQHHRPGDGLRGHLRRGGGGERRIALRQDAAHRPDLQGGDERRVEVFQRRGGGESLACGGTGGASGGCPHDIHALPPRDVQGGAKPGLRRGVPDHTVPRQRGVHPEGNRQAAGRVRPEMGCQFDGHGQGGEVADPRCRHGEVRDVPAEDNLRGGGRFLDRGVPLRDGKPRAHRGSPLGVAHSLHDGIRPDGRRLRADRNVVEGCPGGEAGLRELEGHGGCGDFFGQHHPRGLHQREADRRGDAGD